MNLSTQCRKIDQRENGCRMLSKYKANCRYYIYYHYLFVIVIVYNYHCYLMTKQICLVFFKIAIQVDSWNILFASLK